MANRFLFFFFLSLFGPTRSISTLDTDIGVDRFDLVLHIDTTLFLAVHNQKARGIPRVRLLPKEMETRCVALIRCHQISSPFFFPDNVLVEQKSYWGWHNSSGRPLVGCRPYQARPNAVTSDIDRSPRMSSRWSFKRKDKMKALVLLVVGKEILLDKTLFSRKPNHLWFLRWKSIKSFSLITAFFWIWERSSSRRAFGIFTERQFRLTHSVQLDRASFIGELCGWRPADNPIMSGRVPHNNVEITQRTPLPRLFKSFQYR